MPSASSRIQIGTGVSITGTRIAPVTAHSIATINALKGVPGIKHLVILTAGMPMFGNGIDLQPVARAAAAAGPVRLQVETRSRFFQPATELAVVAEARGSARPEERFVYSAHVQEPGANDDASGVGTLTEMARTLAQLVKAGRVDPKRTITMLWGQEIRVTDRYLKQDTVRLKGVHWGISLDMTGEDTQKTGGTFLIEKMPDPSAIWTRGDDKHTEWGGRPLAEKVSRAHLV